MAHIRDRWERTIDGRWVRTARYGKGKRWQSRYRDPEGRERNRDFERKQDAERFLAAASVRLPKRDVRRIEPWTVERVQAVIEALPDRYRATAVVAAGCGLRQGEVFGLRVSDVDFLRRRLRVEQQVKIVRSRVEIDRPKNGKVRTVPLPDAVAEALSEHLRRYPPGDDGLVFTSREHKPINRNHFNRYVWRPALVRAGVGEERGNGMHALRRFCASVLIDGGESVRAVADFLGHADPGFTLRIYAHLLPASEDRARRLMGDLLSGPRLGPLTRGKVAPGR